MSDGPHKIEKMNFEPSEYRRLAGLEPRFSLPASDEAADAAALIRREVDVEGPDDYLVRIGWKPWEAQADAVRFAAEVSEALGIHLELGEPRIGPGKFGVQWPVEHNGDEIASWMTPPPGLPEEHRKVLVDVYTEQLRLKMGKTPQGGFQRTPETEKAAAEFLVPLEERIGIELGLGKTLIDPDNFCAYKQILHKGECVAVVQAMDDVAYPRSSRERQLKAVERQIRSSLGQEITSEPIFATRKGIGQVLMLQLVRFQESRHTDRPGDADELPEPLQLASNALLTVVERFENLPDDVVVVDCMGESRMLMREKRNGEQRQDLVGIREHEVDFDEIEYLGQYVSALPSRREEIEQALGNCIADYMEKQVCALGDDGEFFRYLVVREAPWVEVDDENRLQVGAKFTVV